MKKIISIIMLSTIILTMVGCGQTKNEDNTVILNSTSSNIENIESQIKEIETTNNKENEIKEDIIEKYKTFGTVLDITHEYIAIDTITQGEVHFVVSNNIDTSTINIGNKVIVEYENKMTLDLPPQCNLISIVNTDINYTMLEGTIIEIGDKTLFANINDYGNIYFNIPDSLDLKNSCTDDLIRVVAEDKIFETYPAQGTALYIFTARAEAFINNIKEDSENNNIEIPLELYTSKGTIREIRNVEDGVKTLMSTHTVNDNILYYFKTEDSKDLDISQFKIGDRVAIDYELSRIGTNPLEHYAYGIQMVNLI